MIGNGNDFLDSLRISCKINKKKYENYFEFEGRWFSEAFLGPMYSLMHSINDNTEPRTNIYDAFETLLLLENVIKNFENKK